MRRLGGGRGPGRRTGRDYNHSVARVSVGCIVGRATRPGRAGSLHGGGSRRSDNDSRGTARGA